MLWEAVLSLSALPSHHLFFPPLFFVDIDIESGESFFQKYVFLIPCLLGERGTSMLGWVAKKNPALYVEHLLLSQGALDKEKWALHLVFTPYTVADSGLQIPAMERQY